MKELVEEVAEALVDSPDGVSVHAVEGEQVTVLELRVAPSDLGKVMGNRAQAACHPHDPRSGQYEAQPPLHLGNSGVAISEPNQKPLLGHPRVTVAVLGRPWGIRGELTAIPFSDRPTASRLWTSLPVRERSGAGV